MSGWRCVGSGMIVDVVVALDVGAASADDEDRDDGVVADGDEELVAGFRHLFDEDLGLELRIYGSGIGRGVVCARVCVT